ncbi:MAG: hypothetical protein KUG57_04155 [Ilumatobacteraceae bacterium]|nr:hypothetical protein [Ilumatobacteraceae bacterium]
MTRRAIPAFVVLVVGFAALLMLGRSDSVSPAPVFSAPAGTWMPSVAESNALTGSWFCPGVPATGEDGVGGEVVVSNRDSEQLIGRFSILTQEGREAEQAFTVEPWSQTSVDVDAFVTAPFASVVVEIDGGRGLVEQRAIHPAGDSVAPCANDTSSEWYFADGFTVDGSVETLVLTNPYDDAAAVNLGFATESGPAAPAAFQGFTILPRSVRTIRIADLGARDEPVIAVNIEAISGRIVAGRAQHYLGGGRLGFNVTLAAPALRDQFWFADGEQGEGITETFAIYNPTDSDVEVDVVFLGLPLDANFGDLPQVQVPAREVVVFDPADEETGSSVPDGRHATVFSTLAEPSIVVERVLTRPAGDSVATSVVMGAPPRPDGYVASRWHVGSGPSTSTGATIVVYNVDNLEGSIAVESVGPAGPSAHDEFADIPIGPGAVITIDLEESELLGRELIITASNRVFVELLLPRGHDLPGWSGSWALPASDA